MILQNVELSTDFVRVSCAAISIEGLYSRFLPHKIHRKNRNAAASQDAEEEP